MDVRLSVGIIVVYLANSHVQAIARVAALENVKELIKAIVEVAPIVGLPAVAHAVPPVKVSVQRGVKMVAPAVVVLLVQVSAQVVVHRLVLVVAEADVALPVQEDVLAVVQRLVLVVVEVDVVPLVQEDAMTDAIQHVLQIVQIIVLANAPMTAQRPVEMAAQVTVVDNAYNIVLHNVRMVHKEDLVAIMVAQAIVAIIVFRPVVAMRAKICVQEHVRVG